VKSVTESQTQRACLDFLAAKRIFHMRMQTGALRNPAGRPVKFGTPGCADIMAILPSKLVLWLEIKAPGKKQRPAQTEFQAEVENHGHAYMVIRDVNELIHYIDGIY
jgi:hypothetical protein